MKTQDQIIFECLKEAYGKNSPKTLEQYLRELNFKPAAHIGHNAIKKAMDIWVDQKPPSQASPDAPDSTIV